MGCNKKIFLDSTFSRKPNSALSQRLVSQTRQTTLKLGAGHSKKPTNSKTEWTSCTHLHIFDIQEFINNRKSFLFHRFSCHFGYCRGINWSVKRNIARRTSCWRRFSRCSRRLASAFTLLTSTLKREQTIQAEIKTKCFGRVFNFLRMNGLHSLTLTIKVKRNIKL